MSVYQIYDSTLSNIADAIREKLEETENITPLEMPEKIRSIQGGDCCSDFCLCNIEDLEVTKNGEAILCVSSYGLEPHEGCEILDVSLNNLGELILSCGIYGVVWPDTVNHIFNFFVKGEYKELGDFVIDNIVSSVNNNNVNKISFNFENIYQHKFIGNFKSTTQYNNNNSIKRENVIMEVDI